MIQKIFIASIIFISNLSFAACVTNIHTIIECKHDITVSADNLQILNLLYSGSEVGELGISEDRFERVSGGYSWCSVNDNQIHNLPELSDKATKKICKLFKKR